MRCPLRRAVTALLGLCLLLVLDAANSQTNPLSLALLVLAAAGYWLLGYWRDPKPPQPEDEERP